MTQRLTPRQHDVLRVLVLSDRELRAAAIGHKLQLPTRVTAASVLPALRKLVGLKLATRIEEAPRQVFYRATPFGKTEQIELIRRGPPEKRRPVLGVGR